MVVISDDSHPRTREDKVTACRISTQHMNCNKQYIHRRGVDKLVLIAVEKGHVVLARERAEREREKERVHERKRER
jgi:hypothetical protein